MRISRIVARSGIPVLMLALLSVTGRAAEPGNPVSASAAVGSQKAGSVLFYNLYSSDAVHASPLEESEINLTNTSAVVTVGVRLFFVNGTGRVKSEYFCLAPNQTVTLLASQVDPGGTGYILAVAVDGATGCPVSHNFLSGDTYIKLATGHAARLPAVALSALYSGQLAGCTINSTKATLTFDGSGTGYNRVPRTIAATSIQSRADGNSPLLVVNRVGGDLSTGAGRIGGVSGTLINDFTEEADFTAAFDSAQFLALLGNGFPPVNPPFNQHIPAGTTGWAKLAAQGEAGLLGSIINFNPNAATSSGSFNGGYNLSFLTLAPTESYQIPVAPLGCNNRPVLSELDPGSVGVVGQAQTLTLRGLGFTMGASVRWNGQDRPAAFVNSRQLTIQLSANDVSTAGRTSIAVVNPGPGAAASNALSFLAIGQGSEQEPNQQPAQATPIAAPGRRTGAVALGDATGLTITFSDGSTDPIEDLFAVTLTAAAHLDLRLIATGSNLTNVDLDLFLLRETDGAVIGFGATPDYREHITTGAPLSPGRYLIGVSAYTGSTSYSLAVVIEEAVLPTVTPVSAASFAGTDFSAEAIVAAFGSSLSAATQSAAMQPLPTEMAGTRVSIRDSAGATREAPLFYVSPEQINLLIPPGTAPGAATMNILRGGQVVAAGTMQIALVAPGLFTANSTGAGVAAAQALRVRADSSQQYESVARFDIAQQRFVPAPIDLGPPSDQVFLILYGTGLRGRSALPAVTATITNAGQAQSLGVLYAGPAPDFAGLDQVNLALPRSLIGFGEAEITLTLDGKQANKVRIQIR